MTDGGTIWVYDVAKGRPIRGIAVPGFQVSSLALSPDGRFVAAGVEQAIRLWHMASGREVALHMSHEPKASGAPSGYAVAAFSADGRLLVSGSGADFSGTD